MQWVSALVVSSLCGLTACGGLQASDLTASDGSTAAPTPDAGHATDAPGVTILPTVDAGHPGHDASTTPDVGVSMDVGVVQMEAAAPPPPAMVTISCPTASGSCTGPAPIACCVTEPQFGFGNPTATCQSPADPATCQQSGGAAVQCGSTSDCPAGEECCGTKNQDQSAYLSVQCEAQCGDQEVQFCAQGSNDCGNDEQCIQSSLLQPYYVCD